MKKFRKRDNTASLTEELLNISEDDKETEEAIEPAPNEELEEKTEDNEEPLDAGEDEEYKKTELDDEQRQKMREKIDSINALTNRLLKKYIADHPNGEDEEIEDEGTINPFLFGGFGNDSYDEWENEDEEPQTLKSEDELISFFGGFGNDSYDEEPQIKQSIYYGYHEKEKKNKRLQLLINGEVLEDLRSEALSHDISVNELVNRLIKHFLYDNE